jgi:hypothetical protein
MRHKRQQQEWVSPDLAEHGQRVARMPGAASGTTANKAARNTIFFMVSRSLIK